MATLPEPMHNPPPCGADPMRPEPHRVARVRQETHDTFTLELATLEDQNRFLFRPGQFNMLYVFGVGEVPISISGDPAKPTRLVHTTRAVGAITKAMRKLKRGDRLAVRGPYGRGWPIDRARRKDVVMVAGGIGLAPLRPAMYTLLAQRELFGKVVLLYGARSPAEILFQKELEQWRMHLDLEIYVTVDRAMEKWRGNVGFVTPLISKALFDPLHTVALVCGPEVMMRFAALELMKRGVPSGDIYLSMERNMKCAVGFCGHCQYGPKFICKDGPVFPYMEIKDLLAQWEI